MATRTYVAPPCRVLKVPGNFAETVLRLLSERGHAMRSSQPPSVRVAVKNDVAVMMVTRATCDKGKT